MDVIERSRPVPVAVLAAVALIAAIFALRLLDLQRIEWIRTYLVIFGALLVQALPFVMLGALAAAVVEVFVPLRTLERLGRLPRAAQLPVAALAGLLFPICECGSVPVARRLALRGLTPAAAVTFMLASPVINPVVIGSTFVAYRGRATTWTMVGGRFLLGMLVAIAVGWAIGDRSPGELVKVDADGGNAYPMELGRPEPRWRRFFLHLGDDFVFMGRFLVLGATIAAAIQTFLPASILTTAGAVPIVSIVVMMVLAAALSLCSESDAFVAASFVQFGPSAQLAFLVSGPMIDAKLLPLYAGTFRRGFVRTLVAIVAATTLAGTMWLGVVTG